MADLTTLSDLKLYLGVASSDTDDFYSMLITQASNIIENELGSGVLAADYSETYNGDGTTTMMLDNYPVLEVYRATDSVENSMYITNTNTDNTHATVQVTDSKIVLKKANAGTWTTSDIIRSDYSTLSAVETAINAYGDWSCVVTSTYEDYPVTEILESTGRNARVNNVYVCVPSRCETDYKIENVNRAVLYNTYRWACGHRNIFISYRAGYETIPDAIQSLCQELVKVLYDKSKVSAAYNKEEIGDYSYSTGNLWQAASAGSSLKELSPTLYIKLMPYIRLLSA